ncbi:MAG TPA: type IV secretion system DNA-binding domain-containing protein, partial [bacterium]|nr:type IV secretion system DNA-binding domain-containing protein [bacterium]
MWHQIVILWLTAIFLSAIAWSHAHGANKRRAMKRVVHLIGYGVPIVFAWEWFDALPLGGILAKMALVAGLLWYLAYRVWTRTFLAWRVRGQQSQRLRTLAGEQDPRDLGRLRWSQVTYDRDRALAPYLHAKVGAYWLARSDPLPCRRWWGLTLHRAYDVAVPKDLMLRHMLILGSTGAGKTRTALQGIVEQQVARGLGAIVLQFKHDELFYRSVLDAVVRAGREVDCVYFSLRSDDEGRTAAWNPFDWPNSGEVAEAVVHATLDDLPALRYFAAQNLDALAVVLEGAQRQGETLSFGRLADLLAQTGRSGAGQPLLAYLRPFPELRARAQRVRWDHASELKMLAAQLGRFGALTPAPNRIALNLRTAVQRGQVVLVNLDATTFPKAAQCVGRLFIVALSATYSGLRRTEADQVYLVALDEFGPVAGPHLSSMLGTARGFGVSLVLATQSLADLRIAGQRETAGALAAQVVENIGTQVVFGLRNPQDAKWWSDASGSVLRDEMTDVLVDGRADGNYLNRRQASQRESASVSINQLLFTPRAKAFVWIPSRRCLRAPGNRSAYLSQEPDRRSVILANFALPPDPSSWPEVQGGSIGGVGRTHANAPPIGSATPDRQSEPKVKKHGHAASSHFLAGGVIGRTLSGSMTCPMDGPESTRLTRPDETDAGG